MDPIEATCPFCGAKAKATRPTKDGKEVDGFVYTTESCDHCRGILAGGRWDEGMFLFEGGLPNSIKWRAEDLEIDANGILHAINILEGMKG